MRAALGIPDRIVPIAYLCLGYVSAFHDKPELESKGWARREDLGDLVSYDQWRAPRHDARGEASRRPQNVLPGLVPGIHAGP